MEAGGETTKRVRGPKTRAQKRLAAEASQRYRAGRKAAGIPTNEAIDGAVASTFLKGLYRPGGLQADHKSVPRIVASVIMRMSWDSQNEAVQRAIADRVAHLTGRTWPGAANGMAPAADEAEAVGRQDADAPSTGALDSAEAPASPAEIEGPPHGDSLPSQTDEPTVRLERTVDPLIFGSRRAGGKEPKLLGRFRGETTASRTLGVGDTRTKTLQVALGFFPRIRKRLW